jgi:hypothetical protein
MFRVTWATYHDCDHICIARMVDLLFMRWFMWCKDVFVSDVWVDVYVTPFLCACSNQTSMLGFVRGMCALVGVMWHSKNRVVAISGWHVKSISRRVLDRWRKDAQVDRFRRGNNNPRNLETKQLWPWRKNNPFSDQFMVISTSKGILKILTDGWNKIWASNRVWPFDISYDDSQKLPQATPRFLLQFTS